MGRGIGRGITAALVLGGAVQTLGAQELPRLHHAHLNTVDAEAAIEWYRTIWPEGSAGEVAGFPAFIAEMPLLFTEVDAPPAGSWDRTLQRAEPQSPFWHIGGFVNTTGVFARLREEGVRPIELEVGPGWGDPVDRSGLTPYSGIRDRNRLAGAEAAAPRPGGFGYLEGPDGALVELTGSVRTTASFSHVHLFHESPRCAANWYVEVLGFRHAPYRDPDTGDRRERERWEPCEADGGTRGWPSLERAGTLRSPNATIVHASGSISIYPRQGDVPLVPSRGQVLDHVAFEVSDLTERVERVRASGAAILEEIHPFADTRAALIEGPDGLAMKLVERTGG